MRHLRSLLLLAAAVSLSVFACVGDDPQGVIAPGADASTSDGPSPGSDGGNPSDGATEAGDVDAGPPKAVGDVQWVKAITAGAGSTVVVTATAFDPQGNVVVAGLYASTNATLDFGDGKSLPVAGNINGFVVKYSAAGVCQWAVALDGPGSDLIVALAIDAPTGDVIFGGQTDGASVAIGGKNATRPVSAGGDDLFLGRLDPAGVGKWLTMFGGAASDELTSIDVGTAGILVSGSMKRTTVADVTVGAITVPIPPNRTERAAVVLKFDASGSPAWAKGFPTSAAGSDSVANAARFDALGNVVTGGAFTGTIDLRYLDGSAQSKTLTSDGLRDGWVAKFDGSTRLLGWGVRLGGAADDLVRSIALDAAGNAHVASSYTGPGPVSVGSVTLPVFGGVDTAVTTIDPGGTFGASRGFGTSDKDAVAAIAVDRWGSIVVAGEANASLPFDDKTATAQGARDGFVAKLDPARVAQWALGVGGASNDTVTAMAVHATGEVAIVGNFVGTAKFGTVVANAGGVNNPGGFVAKLSP